jgi:hypothetical protein
VDLLGGKGKLHVCKDCQNGGKFICCSSVSQVPCGQTVCDECESEYHSGFECNSCYQARKHGY